MNNFEYVESIQDLEAEAAAARRKLALRAIFGPSVATAANSERSTIENGPSIDAVHEAISSVLVREHPDSVQKNGLKDAIKNYDNGFGMQVFEPAPVDFNPNIPRHEARRQWRVEQKKNYRNEMLDSRYTVTLGQAINTLLPHIDDIDKRASDVFTVKTKNQFSERAFDNIWGELAKQDSYSETFSGVMRVLNYHESLGVPRNVPNAGSMNFCNLNFMMTEADVKKVFSKPIAQMLESNLNNTTVDTDRLHTLADNL